jgi:hypothetical protein
MIFKIYGRVLNVLLLLIIALAGCSGDGGKESAESGKTTLPHYHNWTTYTYRNFIYHYAADAYWRKDMPSLTDAFERVLIDDCGFLGIPLPEEEIHVFIYADPTEAEDLIDKELPYVVDNQIHWERMTTPYGRGVMMYILDNWELGKPVYQFLYDGLVTLRDYSKRNYHIWTGRFIDEGRYIPVDTLMNAESYNRRQVQIREWEAASLVAFITLNYGVDRFKILWQSEGDIDDISKELFGMDIKSFELYWNEYALTQFYEAQKADTTEGQ